MPWDALKKRFRVINEKNHRVSRRDEIKGRVGKVDLEQGRELSVIMKSPAR